VHDFFNVIGVPQSARAVEVRRLTARYVRRSHPDFRPSSPDLPSADPGAPRDAAVDYVDPLTFLGRIQHAFFASPDPAG
jgi:hypothetical protein